MHKADNKPNNTFIKKGGQSYKVQMQSFGCQNESVLEIVQKNISIQVQCLVKELEWLDKAFEQRLIESDNQRSDLIILPELEESVYTDFIRSHQLSDNERILLLTILCFSWKGKQLIGKLEKLGPEIHVIYNRLEELGIGFNRMVNKIKITPFAIANLITKGKDCEIEQCIYEFENSILIKEGVILAESENENAYFFTRDLRLDSAYLRHFITGQQLRIDQTENFRAKLIETNLTFDSLMLNAKSKLSLQSLIDYIENYKKFHSSEHTGQRLRQGYVAMFHGYPGTGKSLTAKIIGKETGLPTYRVDLSQVISKYIGETEKNLEAIFSKLEHKDCILFFDEADALFGKRSKVSESKDRYANQEVSYLLQRIEELDFIVILATNYTNNMDAAFRRRINTYIRMDPPDAEVRMKLWDYYFPYDDYTLDPPNLIEIAAHKYAITGANIHNIVKHACSEALVNGNNVVTGEILGDYLAKEYYKEGRNINNPDQFSWEQMADMG